MISAATPRDADEREQLTLQACAFDRETILQRPALLDRLVDELLDEMGRRQVVRIDVLAMVQRGALNRAQNRRLERAILFLEIEGDLRIADPSAKRLHEPDGNQRRKDQERENSETDDGGGAEP